MLFRILNAITKSKVNKIRPIAISFLTNDLKQQEDLLVKVREGKDSLVNLVYGSDSSSIEKNIEMIKGRVNVDKQYSTLLGCFTSDQKRSYMINRDYLNYLRAIMFLYKTSQASVSVGVLTASADVYHTINAVQESFEELMKSLSLGSN